MINANKNPRPALNLRRQFASIFAGKLTLRRLICGNDSFVLRVVGVDRQQLKANGQEPVGTASREPRSISKLTKAQASSDVVDAVVYLTAAHNITEEVLHVDGGAHHQGRW